MVLEVIGDVGYGGGLGEGGMASLGETWQEGEESLVGEDVTGEPKMEMEMEETGEEHVGSESI